MIVNAFIEEERRLLYVAMIRAKKKLFILYVLMDSSWQVLQPSRFLKEIPKYLQEGEPQLQVHLASRSTFFHTIHDECFNIFPHYFDSMELIQACNGNSFIKRHQIVMSKKLIEDGTKAWNLVSKNNKQVLWENLSSEIEKQFKKIFMLQHKIFIVGGIGAFAENCWMPRISAKGLQDPGTFVLRFPTSRSWPHPDAGNLVVTYVGSDYNIHHKLLYLDSIYRICCGGIQVRE